MDLCVAVRSVGPIKSFKVYVDCRYKSRTEVDIVYKVHDKNLRIFNAWVSLTSLTFPEEQAIFYFTLPIYIVVGTGRRGKSSEVNHTIVVHFLTFSI